MPATPLLTTERLILRPFRLEDSGAVQHLAGAREVADTTSSLPHPYDDSMAEMWIATHADAWERGEQFHCAITTTGNGLVGAIGLNLDKQNRRAELGYWIGVPFWCRGYATEAARAVVVFGFESLGLNRIHAATFTRNPASGRVLEKIGMRCEGILRAHVLKWNKPEDVATYAILRSDLP